MKLTALSFLSLLLYCVSVRARAYPQGNDLSNQAGQSTSNTVASNMNDQQMNTNSILLSGGSGGGGGSGDQMTNYDKSANQTDRIQNTKTGEKTVTKTGETTSTGTGSDTSTVRNEGASTLANYDMQKGAIFTEEQFQDFLDAINEL